jgi:hypothetical protein
VPCDDLPWPEQPRAGGWGSAWSTIQWSSTWVMRSRTEASSTFRWAAPSRRTENCLILGWLIFRLIYI